MYIVLSLSIKNFLCVFVLFIKTYIMKKSCFIIVFLFLTANLYSQTTYVPDDNFEQALINLGYDTGTLDDYGLQQILLRLLI